jgi:nitrite reductase/ring-hydroxylating ferredoxin subunit
MPELNLAPQPLCASSALLETGDAALFEVLDMADGGRPAPAFAVRHDNTVVAYLNRCAHVPSEMDWQPGKFWDLDRRYIICAVHGALYEPPNGECVSGPCTGARLQAIRVSESGEQVCWYPDARFQPVF